ncbi:hypothetical protein GCM10009802_42670 [Streptomyces synnematoformans]|uniref:Uncharacterized protein n=1 Tax=Streptomyces synnematoformans TaxID=415721 RepID=A0ABN2YYR1_9ACTN
MSSARSPAHTAAATKSRAFPTERAPRANIRACVIPSPATCLYAIAIPANPTVRPPPTASIYYVA